MEHEATKNQTDAVDDPVGRLASDHEQMLVLLLTLALSTERAVCSRGKTLAKLVKALRIHLTLEEEILLPAFWAASRTADDAVLWAEALAMHEAVERLFAQLAETDLATTKFRALSKVLYELLSQRARQNEVALFPRVRVLIDDQTLAALSTRMDRRRSKLESELDAAHQRRDGGAPADPGVALACWDEPTGDEESEAVYISS